MNNTLSSSAPNLPKLSPWLFALLVATSCARTETVDSPSPAPAPPPAVASAAPRDGSGDTAESAIKVPIDGLPAFGKTDALVTVVAFTDYECPYCEKADTSLEQLRDDYGDKVRFVVASQPLPMHEHALPAAKAFLAANQLGKGEAMHKKLFALTRAKTVLTDEVLRNAAVELGLDAKPFDDLRASPAIADAVTKSQALATRLDVRGTPSFFVNGRRLVGARPVETFRALFDEELTKAAKLPNGSYESMMKGFADAPPPKGPEALEHFDVDVARAPMRGTKNGAITVAFFSDFECPYCVRAEKTLRDLEAQKPGQVKVVYKFRPLPMHAHARDAAKAAIAAEKQGKFWEYHDVLLQHRDALEHDDLVKYAGEVGLDIARFETDLNDPAAEERIKADEKQADALGAKGTPTAFVNGYRLIGAQPLGTWVGVADKALEKR